MEWVPNMEWEHHDVEVGEGDGRAVMAHAAEQLQLRGADLWRVGVRV